MDDIMNTQKDLVQEMVWRNLDNALNDALSELSITGAGRAMKAYINQLSPDTREHMKQSFDSIKTFIEAGDLNIFDDRFGEVEILVDMIEFTKGEKYVVVLHGTFKSKMILSDDGLRYYEVIPLIEQGHAKWVE